MEDKERKKNAKFSNKWMKTNVGRTWNYNLNLDPFKQVAKRGNYVHSLAQIKSLLSHSK